MSHVVIPRFLKSVCHFYDLEENHASLKRGKFGKGTGLKRQTVITSCTKN